MNEFELIASVPDMQKLLWASRSEREKLQKLGLNVVPANFYSSIPSISEILESYEYHESAPPYLDARIFDASRLYKNLVALLPYSADFEPIEHDNEKTCRRFFWKNSQFSYSDAMSYYAYLRQIKPRKVVEIGSGFSSLIAIEALQANGFGTLTCIEPYPRPFISALGSEGALDLRAVRAQDLTPEMLNTMLEDGDVLFIDSTHTVKTGSDCVHIYLRLLPNLTKRVLIHVHDIFLPFGMPQKWLLDTHIYWTEQYLLMAWMIDNLRVTLLYGSAYHDHFNGELLQGLMRGRYQRGGSSFWIQYDGSMGAFS